MQWPLLAFSLIPIAAPCASLHDTVRSCDIANLAQLLQQGASPNATSDVGDTPLHVAARHGKPQCMYVLLASGGNKYPWNYRRETADLIARNYSDGIIREQMLALLQSPGIPVHDTVDVALNRATLRGQSVLVRLFLDMRANPNAQGSDGNTPLHNSCLRGTTQIAELLLQSGALTDIYSSGGTMPLHDAAVTGHASIISLLLAHGAPPEGRTKESGETPLHLAAAWGRKEVVNVLLAAGAGIDLRDAKGRTAQTVAAENGNNEIAALLTAAGKP